MMPHWYIRAWKDATNGEEDEYRLINMKGKNWSSEQHKITEDNRGEEATNTTLVPEVSAA